MHIKSLFFAFLFAFVAAQSENLTEVILSQPDLSLLADALTVVPDFAAGLNALSNITILAPTDSAFEALLAEGLNAENQAIETRDPDGVSTLLAYHVLKGIFTSSDFSDTPTYYNTIFNQSYSIFDTVRTNVTAGQNLGLVLNDSEAIIISGELATSNVVEADISPYPGVIIHKIDKVLTIPLNLSDTLVRLPQLGTSAALGALDTVDLISRVQPTGEDPTGLDIADDLTIFIPNDDAFVTAASAFQNASVKQLRDVLEYHAILGSIVFASDITNTTVESVQGNDLTLSVGTDGTVYVDNARVVFPNILLSNGVAHIIDSVLNPASDDIDRENLDPNATATPDFSGATAVGTEIPFTASAITASTTIDIPAIATTARYVTPGEGSANMTATPSGGASPPEFTGAAEKLQSMVGGAVMGFGVALLL